VNFFDADGLPGKNLAEIDFFATQANPTAPGDHDGFVVERIVDVRQSGIRTRRGLIDFGRTLHVEGFVRTFVVEDLDELVEPSLLLQKIPNGRLVASFFSVRCMRSWRPFCCG
jgi:hypothetical protein